MLREVGRYVERHGLLASSDRVLCMVSGGADSTAMLHLLHGLSQGSEQPSLRGFSLGVCHVNYGLRGEASDADEEFVRRLGDALGVQVHTIRAPEPPPANFQAWARKLRYEAARNLCRWQGYSRIATGHNRDDRVETFLYRLITYSGRRSLAVMPPRAGKVIRPLLFMSAAAVREYCAAAGISYHDDESNRRPAYRRNRIRLEVVPHLEAIRPDFRERIEETISLLEDEERVLKSVTDDAYREALAEDGESLNATALSLMDRAVARLVLRRWLSQGTEGVRITRRLLDAAVDLCRDSHGTRSLALAGGRKLERRYDQLVVTPGDERAPDPVELPLPGEIIFGDYRVEAREGSWPAPLLSDPMHVQVDAARIRPPLQVRSRRAGDRFRPLGMSGAKSIKEFMVDAKIPRGERDRVPLVVNGDGEIVWVCGMRIAEDFKVTGATEKVVELRAYWRRLDEGI